MAIQFHCECGKRLNAPDGSAGRNARCPSCGKIQTIPAAAGVANVGSIASQQPTNEDDTIALADDSPRAFAPKPIPAFLRTDESVRPLVAAAAATAPPPPGIRRHLYWLLLLVLIPLAWSTLHKSADDATFEQRLRQTVRAHPEAREKLQSLGDEASKSDLFAALPGDKLDGALFAEQTWMHWVLAAVSGAAFLAAVLLLFPAGHAKVGHLASIGLLTGTLGILLLLAFQWVAFHMPLFKGHGWLTLLLDLIWLIGQSYRMALGDYGFPLSFLGFTAGVGFCEEACKALPLIFRAHTHGYSSWRSAMLWGLISGIGFGVSEGITYSTDYYNGISGIDLYLVRFVSCVGLHGIWAGAVGITIFRRQEFFQGSRHPLEWIWRTLQAVAVPMVLHGLYDTLLKQNYQTWALVVAVASFAWLAIQIEMATRLHHDNETKEWYAAA